MNYDYVIFFDGGHSEGKLGVAAVVVDPEFRIVTESARYAGHGTSNVAEYRALEYATCMANLVGARRPLFYGDSMLVVQQVNGCWAMKGETDSPLAVAHSRCGSALMRFDTWALRHVVRERNKRADWLVSSLLGHKRALKNAPGVDQLQVGEELVGRPGWDALAPSRKRAA